MEISEIRNRISRLDDALEGKTALEAGYKGSDRPEEINAYIERIHNTLTAAIFDGAESKRGSAELLDEYKNSISRAYGLSKDRLMARLRSGEQYDQYAQALLKERLFDEAGTQYTNKALRINAHIRLNMHSDALAGVTSELGEPYFYFNPKGVILLSREQKKTALDHEVAHLALGHLDPAYTPNHDRRKEELDAVYVGALISGNFNECREMNRLAYDIEQAERELGPSSAQKLERRKAMLYNRAGRSPGEDKELDAHMGHLLEEYRHHAIHSEKHILPAREERIGVIDELQKQIEGSRIKSWARRELLRKAIKERHVRTGPSPD